jgi:hypothetical protein
MNVIPARGVSANPTHEQGVAVNLRKKSTREEFERALAQCTPEDFDGHTEFYRLTPEQRLECSVRQQPSFTSSKVKRILPFETDRDNESKMVSKGACLVFSCSCS